MGSVTNLSKPNFRSSLFARISYDLDDETNIYLEALHSDSTVKGHQGYIGPDIFTGGSSGIAIKRDNAYLTPAMAARMDPAGVSTISIRKIFDNVNNWGKNSTDRIVSSVGTDAQSSFGFFKDNNADHLPSWVDYTKGTHKSAFETHQPVFMSLAMQEKSALRGTY